MEVRPPDSSEAMSAEPQKRNRARERQAARKARQSRQQQRNLSLNMPDVNLPEVKIPSAKLPGGKLPVDKLPTDQIAVIRDQLAALLRRLQDAAYGMSWRKMLGRAPLIIGLLVVLIVVFSLSSLYSSEDVFSGVKVGGVALGGLSEEQAAATLAARWAEHDLSLRDGERSWSVPAEEMGFTIDAVTSARRALDYGREQGGIGAVLRAMIAGVDLDPVLEYNDEQARDALLHYVGSINVPPQNATVRLQGALVTHIPAQDGYRVEISRLIPLLGMDPLAVVQEGVIELPMQPVPALITDATPLVAYAQGLLDRSLQFEAYDPVGDETYQLDALPGEWGQWLDTQLIYHDTGPRLYLSVAAAPVREYLQEQSASLPEPLTLDIADGVRAMQEAVATGSLSTWVTVRYLPTVHTVARGESAYSISRTAGIPFFMLEQANPDAALEELYPGDQVQIPSRDAMLPFRPIRNKRIVVDLSEQYLWAYEDGEIVFEWLISSGMSSAPTSTGIYQILSHAELAYGSSYTLCDDENSSCGQWKMHWFMGVYEAVPGLMNGFHGAVELPNGAYLGGGNVGRPYTFGCIMSMEDNAYLLYEWADEGVVVEIRQ